MTDIKMLPLPETLVRSGFKSSAEAFARAVAEHNVRFLTHELANAECAIDAEQAGRKKAEAEIEALRAEVRDLKGQMALAPVGGLGLRDALLRARAKLSDGEWEDLCRMFREQDSIIRRAIAKHNIAVKDAEIEAERAERLAEALRFYADTNNWIGRFVTDPTTPAEEDGGDNAREALRDHDQEGKDAT